MMRKYFIGVTAIFCLLSPVPAEAVGQEPRDPPRSAYQTPLPGTAPLTLQGDIASQLVDGVDKFLLREIDKSVEGRARHWKRDFTTPEAYGRSIEPNRQRLAHILGIRDPR